MFFALRLLGGTPLAQLLEGIWDEDAEEIESSTEFARLELKELKSLLPIPGCVDIHKFDCPLSYKRLLVWFSGERSTVMLVKQDKVMR